MKPLNFRDMAELIVGEAYQRRVPAIESLLKTFYARGLQDGSIAEEAVVGMETQSLIDRLPNAPTTVDWDHHDLNV
jgi:hypothetical protein